MGAERQERPNANFYFVRNHKLRQSVKEKTATSKSENSKDGTKTYHYEEFDMVTGHLRKIYVHEEVHPSDSSKSWKVLNIGLRDSKGELDFVSMYFSSREAGSFLNRLPNIDLTQPVTIKVMKQQDNKNKDKYHTLICVYQDKGEGEEKESKLVPYFWTKETPGQRPNLEQKTVQGKPIWDNSLQLGFYEELIKVKNEEIPNVIRAMQGMGKTKEELVFTDNTSLGIKICTGFTGEAPAEVITVVEEPVKEEAPKTEVAPGEDDLPF